jgi:hypothetical protein
MVSLFCDDNVDTFIVVVGTFCCQIQEADDTRGGCEVVQGKLHVLYSFLRSFICVHSFDVMFVNFKKEQ